MSRYQPGRGRPVVVVSQGALPHVLASEVTLARIVSPGALRWRLRRSRLAGVLRAMRGWLVALWPRDDFAGLDARLLRDIGLERLRIGEIETLRGAPADPGGARGEARPAA